MLAHPNQVVRLHPNHVWVSTLTSIGDLKFCRHSALGHVYQILTRVMSTATHYNAFVVCQAES